jgi:hypothetical protein
VTGVVDGVLEWFVGFEPPPLGRHSTYTLTAEGLLPPQANAAVGAERSTPATNPTTSSRLSPPSTAVL